MKGGNQLTTHHQSWHQHIKKATPSLCFPKCQAPEFPPSWYPAPHPTPAQAPLPFISAQRQETWGQAREVVSDFPLAVQHCAGCFIMHCFIFSTRQLYNVRYVSPLYIWGSWDSEKCVQVPETSGTAQIWIPVCFTLQSLSLPTTQGYLSTSYYWHLGTGVRAQIRFQLCHLLPNCLT